MKKSEILFIARKYFIYFMMYAVIGWLYEVFLEVIVYKWGFSNRGVLFGPYLPVYGFGAIIFILLFYRLSKNKQTKIDKYTTPSLIFIGCAAAATALELATSYILEYLTGSWPWQTYSSYNINFQGRIALSPSIRFGLGGILFIYLFQPIFEKIIDRLSKKTVIIISNVVFTIIVLDLISKFI